MIIMQTLRYSSRRCAIFIILWRIKPKIKKNFSKINHVTIIDNNNYIKTLNRFVYIYNDYVQNPEHDYVQ